MTTQEIIASDIGPVLDGRPLPPKERQAWYYAEARDRYNREMGIVGCSAFEHIVPDDDHEAEQEYRAQEQERDAMRQMGAAQ